MITLIRNLKLNNNNIQMNNTKKCMKTKIKNIS